MSRVYFHSPSGEAELCGRERAHAGVLTTNLTVAALGSLFEYEGSPHPLRRLIAPSHYLHGSTPGLLEKRLSTALGGFSGGPLFVLDGEGIDPFTLCLNTAWRVGSEAVRLLTRLHAQCEIHAWVEGTNREWLADLIERGRRIGVLRGPSDLRDWGTWEKVVDFLRQTDSEPVVMSYSVTDQFPNQYVVTEAGLWTPPEAEDDEDLAGEAWYNLPADEQWRLGMEALRAGQGPEWVPEDWIGDEFHFGDGISAFEVLEAAYRTEP